MKKILVIEDHADVRENLLEILELSGFEAIGAENGKIGVEKALASPPDLVLCDVMMPELDGFGVLNILSKRPATADIPFIFLTAKAEKDDVRRGMNLGADDYVTKPFYKDELLSVIETRLQKADRLRRASGAGEGIAAFVDEAKGFAALQKLSDDRETRRFMRRESIFEEGRSPRYLFQVLSGRVKIFKTSPDGRELILQSVGAGEFLGHFDLLRGTEHAESAAALEDCEVALIPKDDFFKLLLASKDVSARLLKMLAGHVAEKEEQLLKLAYQNVRKRVAEALLTVSAQVGGELQIYRDDLAAMVGTAKESVIRMLSEFRDEGIVEIFDGGRIRILKREKLERMPG